MITTLSIKLCFNRKLSIDFPGNITGETGAGKSIILGALGLVLGKRADLTSLKNKEEKCILKLILKYQNIILLLLKLMI
jgi:DNA repair protein RecN (Recombination protein N)